MMVIYKKKEIEDIDVGSYLFSIKNFVSTKWRRCILAYPNFLWQRISPGCGQ
jgi:hypothetical protein